MYKYVTRAKISKLFCGENPIELIGNYSEAVCTEEVLSANFITFPFSLTHFSWKIDDPIYSWITK